MISSFQMKLWNTRNPMVPVPSKAMAPKSHNFHLKLEIWKWKLNSNDLCQTLLFSGEVEVITSDFWLLIFGLFQHVVCLKYSKFYEEFKSTIRFHIGSAKLKLFNKTCLFWNMESYSSTDNSFSSTPSWASTSSNLTVTSLIFINEWMNVYSLIPYSIFKCIFVMDFSKSKDLLILNFENWNSEK